MTVAAIHTRIIKYDKFGLRTSITGVGMPRAHARTHAYCTSWYGNSAPHSQTSRPSMFVEHSALGTPCRGFAFSHADKNYSTLAISLGLHRDDPARHSWYAGSFLGSQASSCAQPLPSPAVTIIERSPLGSLLGARTRSHLYPLPQILFFATSLPSHSPTLLLTAPLIHYASQIYSSYL